ncbi:hypothetical protein Tco_0091288 [Tanacetum coccineum]
MSTYLKHMGGYTYKQLKGKSFDEIQKLFDKEMKRVNTFVAMGSEVQESKEKKVEGSEETAKGSRKKMLGRKRAGKEQQQESSKKQKVEEEKESDEVEEVDEAELKNHLVIKKDEDIAIDAIPLATKLPVIIDYKLLKEGMMIHYQLIRADGSSKRYSSMIRMLQGIDREDLEALWRIVKAKYGDTRPENEFERVLWGDLKVMFEPDIRSDVWRMLQGYRVTVWKLIDSSGVHFVRRNLKIQKMNIKFRGGLLGLKRLHGFLEVTTAQKDARYQSSGSLETSAATIGITCLNGLVINNMYGRECLCHFIEYGCNNHGSPLISINIAYDQVEFQRISLTGFRSCTSRSHYRSVSKQTTRAADERITTA